MLFLPCVMQLMPHLRKCTHSYSAINQSASWCHCHVTNHSCAPGSKSTVLLWANMVHFKACAICVLQNIRWCSTCCSSAYPDAESLFYFFSHQLYSNITSAQNWKYWRWPCWTPCASPTYSHTHKNTHKVSLPSTECYLLCAVFFPHLLSLSASVPFALLEVPLSLTAQRVSAVPALRPRIYIQM